VYVVFSGPIPQLTMQHAALLYADDGTVLSHDSAGCFWRLCREPDVIHVTVPYSRKVASRPGLVIHRSRTLSDDDTHPAYLPRRTRIERTVLDLLADKRSVDAALGLIADAVREGVTSPERLRAALAARPKTRWRKYVLEALADVQAGAHSALELRDGRLRRGHGLPIGTRQVRRIADGTEYLDVVLVEWGVHIELDGRLGHIRQQGWRGTFRRCPSCPDQLPAGL
jgi:hypothetical protein